MQRRGTDPLNPMADLRAMLPSQRKGGHATGSLTPSNVSMAKSKSSIWTTMLARMMNPLSAEHHSAGAVMAFDGQTELHFFPSNSTQTEWTCYAGMCERFIWPL